MLISRLNCMFVIESSIIPLAVFVPWPACVYCWQTQFVHNKHWNQYKHAKWRHRLFVCYTVNGSSVCSLRLAAAAGGSPGDGNMGQEWPVSRITASFIFYFYFYLFFIYLFFVLFSLLTLSLTSWPLPLRRIGCIVRIFPAPQAYTLILNVLNGFGGTPERCN